MNRVSNTNTLRIGIFGTWYSMWYDKEYYTFLVYKDYKLIEYLNSIFYRLRIPTTHFYLNRLSNKYYYIESDIYLTKPSFYKFTKALFHNKSIFKYISLFESLFDISLLLPINLLKNKNYINNLFNKYSKNTIFKNEFNSFYFLYNINNLYSNINPLPIYFYINFINNIYLLKNEKYIYNKIIENKSDINIISNKNRNQFSVLTNFIEIDRNNYLLKIKKNYLNKNVQKKNDVKSFFFNFATFFNSNINYFYFMINQNISHIKNKIINFISSKIFIVLKFYIFITSTFKDSFKISNYYFLRFYYIFVFLKKKNDLFNFYQIKIKQNIDLSNLNFESKSFELLNKKSGFYFNLKSFLKKSNENLNSSRQYFIYKLSKFIISNFNNNYGFISNFYLRDFNIISRELNNNVLEISKDTIDLVHFRKINKYNLFQKRIISYFKIRYIKVFNFYLQKTIENYTGLNTFLLLTYYVKNFPRYDTKLISDYICYNLKRQHRITRVLNKIGNIHKKLNEKSKKMYVSTFNNIENINNELFSNKYFSYLNYNNIFNSVFFNKVYNNDLSKKFNPVSGIRIEFSGPPKKAQMSKTIAYYNVVHDYKLVGKMPTHTVYADIHYYQSYVKLKRSTFGIKVWLFFHTRILNSNNVNKTIL